MRSWMSDEMLGYPAVFQIGEEVMYGFRKVDPTPDMTEEEFWKRLDDTPWTLTSRRLMTPSEILRRFGDQLSEFGKQQLTDMNQQVTDEQIAAYRTFCISEINAKIQNYKSFGILKNAKNISDGYHTFGELYETRAVLNIALFKYIRWSNKLADGPNPVWRSKLHADNTMFEGMFILGVGSKPGEQITFHYHLDKWDDCDFAETLEKAPEFDGHTPAEALERIKRL